MGRRNIKGGMIGISNFSPLDFDFYVDKSISRTVNSDDSCDIFYTKTPKTHKSKLQIVFNDIDFLIGNKITIADAKIKELSNANVDLIIWSVK